MTEECNELYEDCSDYQPILTIWETRALRKTYLWYTMVLGSDASLQVILPLILWFAAVKKKDYVPVYKIDQSTCVTTPGATASDPSTTECDTYIDRIKVVIPDWRIVAFMSMVVFHSVSYTIQVLLLPLSY